MDVTKHEDIVGIFLTGLLMFLPQFRMVGVGQHLPSLLCVVLTEKSAAEPNQPTSVWLVCELGDVSATEYVAVHILFNFSTTDEFFCCCKYLVTPLNMNYNPLDTHRRLIRPSIPIPLKSVFGSSPWKPMSPHCLVILDSSLTVGINSSHNW